MPKFPIGRIERLYPGKIETSPLGEAIPLSLRKDGVAGVRLVEFQRVDESALREGFRRVEACRATPDYGDIPVRLPAYHVGHLVFRLSFGFPAVLPVDEVIPGVGAGVVVELAHLACTAPAQPSLQLSNLGCFRAILLQVEWFELASDVVQRRSRGLGIRVE